MSTKTIALHPCQHLPWNLTPLPGWAYKEVTRKGWRPARQLLSLPLPGQTWATERSGGPESMNQPSSFLGPRGTQVMPGCRMPGAEKQHAQSRSSGNCFSLVLTFAYMWSWPSGCHAPGLLACLLLMWGTLSYFRRITETTNLRSCLFLSGQEPGYSGILYGEGKDLFLKISSLLKVIFWYKNICSVIYLISPMIQKLGKEKGWYLSIIQEHRLHFPIETMLHVGVCHRVSYKELSLLRITWSPPTYFFKGSCP